MPPDAGPRWTEEAVRGLGVRTDLKTGCSVAGIGYTTGKEYARTGRLPFPAYFVAGKWVVPVSGLLRLLGLAETEEPAPPPASLRAVQ